MPLRAMILLMISAAFVGLVHSLAPGHWLPIVLMTKARRWNTRTAVFGALVAASGHVLVSMILGLVGVAIGVEFFTPHEEVIEHYGGLMIALFGVVYALVAFFRHCHCVGHTHHGPAVDRKKTPFIFLFSLGLSPCIAVLPVFAAAAPRGILGLGCTMIAFAAGVVFALVGATLLVTLGIMKLDHPLLEHYGDVITGAAISLMGIILFFSPF